MDEIERERGLECAPMLWPIGDGDDFVIDLGVENGLVEKSGAWYAYKGDKIGQGKENARNYLKEHPDAAEAIETERTLALHEVERVRDDMYRWPMRLASGTCFSRIPIGYRRA